MHTRPSEAVETVPVQGSLLILSAVIIPVLVVSFTMLYLFPERVGTAYFAWPVRPLMSSMMLGATYISGGYFFMVVLLSRQWRHVRLGFLPITAFAGTLGMATLLHWDGFAQERWAFYVWAIIYFTVPVILPILWYRNQRWTAEADLAREGRLPVASRWAFATLGAVLTVAALLLLLVPEQMVAMWPWTLTALTARVMAAIHILPGLVGLSLAYDGHWSSARYLLQAQALAIVLMLLAVYAGRADFDWAAPTSWVFSGGLSLVLLLIGYTYSAKRA